MSTANTDIRILPVRPAVGLAVVSLIAGILAVLTAQECHQNLERRHHLVASFAPSLVYGSVTWIWWVGITLVLWLLANRWPTALKPSTKMILAHLGTACALAVAHLSLMQYSISFASSYWPEWGRLYGTYDVADPEHFGINIVIYGFICGVCAFLHSRMQMQQAIVQKLEVEKQLAHAQLKALQMQIEPHFLFNTLNAIASLVTQHRNNEANRTLDHLNTILRATLRNAPAEKIPFHEEMKVIESFLVIQQIRFPEQLKVSLKVSSDALDGLVPPFLLQPIIENAICHGVAAMDSQGEIKTSAHRIGDTLHLRVWNSAPGKRLSHHEGHGIGQKNTRERLGHFYSGRHDFQAGHLADGAYEVSIIIPFETVMQ